jgi:glycosyltransferase involved in cell wall biosynthesis
MIMSPALSICVPSRNRQVYFQQTIRDLISHTRPDIEFVFADNSDDPTIMDAFMAEIDDPRVRYLPSVPETLPMQDNWERSMQATSGDWIIFIGDDDFVDPEVVDVIKEIVAKKPAAEVIGWNRLTYKWPDYRPYPGNLALSLKSIVQVAKRDDLIKDMFEWRGASHVPASPFTIYHGAVARPAMERIKAKYCGRYFEHPTVDFDCSFKLLFTANAFVYIARPVSVMGATASSNSAAVGRFEKALENYETFVKEKGNVFESADFMRDFPFKANLGVACSILAAQHWFKNKYGVTIDGWEENFALALANDCSHAMERRTFDQHVELCRRAFAAWKGGKHLAAFAPRFLERRTAGVFTGLAGSSIFVHEDIGNCQTPAELYAIAQSMIVPMSELTYHLGQLNIVEAA